MSAFSCFVFITLFLNIHTGSFAQLIDRSSADNHSIASIEERIVLLGDECWRWRTINADTALKFGLEALALARENNIIQPIPRISNYVGAIYLVYLYNSESAIPYFHQALETSLLVNDSLELGFGYINLGTAFMFTGNVPLALQYNENSLNIFKEINNPRGIAYSYINMGLVNRLDKKYDLSLSI